MTERIATTTITEGFTQKMHSLGRKQFELMKQATTGQRIHMASEGPSVMGRIMDMQTEKRNLNQFYKNAGEAKDLATISFSQINQLKDIMVRAQEIAALTNSDLSADEFGPYSKEIEGLVEQAASIVGSKHLDGKYLFSGASTDTHPLNITRDGNNKITSVVYQGSANVSPKFSISSADKLSPRLETSETQGLATVVTDLISLRDALTSGQSSQVRTAETSLRTSFDTVVAHVGSLGSKLARIEFANSQNTEQFRHLDGEISQEADADLVTTIASFQQAQLAYQAAMRSYSMIQQNSLLDML